MKLYNYLICLGICFLLSACGATRPITHWQNSGKISGSIWYTIEGSSAMKVPLLVQAEWKDTEPVEGNLALVFLHGTLLAQCFYNNVDNNINTQLVCEVKAPFPTATAMAYDCATLVSATINSLQNVDVKIPSEWNFTIIPTQKDIISNDNDDADNHGNDDNESNKRSYIYVLQKKNTRIEFEIKEAIWR